MEKALIALIDGYTLFRLGVRSVLEAKQNIEVVGEADNTDEALILIEDNQPNIALLDTSLPHIFDLTWQMNRRFPSISVILLAEEEDEEEVFKGLKYGVAAYVTRVIECEDLVDITKRVSQGGLPIIEKLFNPNVASLILGEFRAFAIEKRQGITMTPLSFQQAALLGQIEKGNSVGQIASTMKLSEQAINGDLISIRHKLVANEHKHDATLALCYGLSPVTHEIDRVERVDR